MCEFLDTYGDRPQWTAAAGDAESLGEEQPPETGGRRRKCLLVEPEPEPEPKQASLPSTREAPVRPLPAKDSDRQDRADDARTDKLGASLHELFQSALEDMGPFVLLQLDRQKNEPNSGRDSGSGCDGGTGDGGDGDPDASKSGPESVSAPVSSLSGSWPRANKPAGSECDFSDLVLVSNGGEEEEDEEEEEDGSYGVVALDDDHDGDEAWDFETIERPPHFGGFCRTMLT